MLVAQFWITNDFVTLFYKHYSAYEVKSFKHAMYHIKKLLKV